MGNPSRGCPILSRFVRKGGQHGPLFKPRSPGAEVRGAHPCKRRKDGARSLEMMRAEITAEPPAQ